MISTGIGNIALEPILDGNKCKVRIACTEKNKTSDSQIVHFFNFEFYGTAADYAFNNFERGDTIYFEAITREKKIEIDGRNISTVVFRPTNFKLVSKKDQYET